MSELSDDDRKWLEDYIKRSRRDMQEWAKEEAPKMARAARARSNARRNTDGR